MRPIIFLIIVGLTTTLAGQDSLCDNKFCIKVAPLALIDAYSGSSIRIGGEVKLKNNYSISLELGAYLYDLRGNTNNQGLIAKYDLKYYLNKDHLTIGDYFSAELFYKHQSYSTWDTINSSPAIRKDYSIKKDIGCFTMKYGALNVIKKRIIIDCFVGIGIRFKDIKSTLTADENNNIRSVGDYGSNVLANKAGHFILPNFDAGVKIGYRFK